MDQGYLRGLLAALSACGHAKEVVRENSEELCMDWVILVCMKRINALISKLLRDYSRGGLKITPTKIEVIE